MGDQPTTAQHFRMTLMSRTPLCCTRFTLRDASLKRPTGVQQPKEWQYHPQYSLSSLWWSHCYGELLHLLHTLQYLASKGAAPRIDHLIAWFSNLMKMERCSADVLLRAMRQTCKVTFEFRLALSDKSSVLVCVARACHTAVRGT